MEGGDDRGDDKGRKILAPVHGCSSDMLHGSEERYLEVGIPLMLPTPKRMTPMHPWEQLWSPSLVQDVHASFISRPLQEHDIKRITLILILILTSTRKLKIE